METTIVNLPRAIDLRNLWPVRLLFFPQQNAEEFDIQAVIPVASLTTFKLRELFIAVSSDKPLILSHNENFIFLGRNTMVSQQVGKDV